MLKNSEGALFYLNIALPKLCKYFFIRVSKAVLFKVNDSIKVRKEIIVTHRTY